ncbi:MAG TPA: hypothetical protein VMW83_09700 [Spirochaetia bacterium]|nr:hypothetical protein [Spirochaetia bacterium]
MDFTVFAGGMVLGGLAAGGVTGYWGVRTKSRYQADITQIDGDAARWNQV